MNSTQFNTAVAYWPTCMAIALYMIGIVLMLMGVVWAIAGLAYLYTAWKQGRGK